MTEDGDAVTTRCPDCERGTVHVTKQGKPQNFSEEQGKPKEFSEEAESSQEFTGKFENLREPFKKKSEDLLIFFTFP